MEEKQQLSDPEEIMRLVNEQVEDECSRFSALLEREGSGSSKDCLFNEKEIEDALRENEDGDAWIYIELHRDLFVFDAAADRWYKWGGHFWIEDFLNDAMRGIDAVISVYLNEFDCLSLKAKKEIVNEYGGIEETGD